MTFLLSQFEINFVLRNVFACQVNQGLDCGGLFT